MCPKGTQKCPRTALGRLLGHSWELLGRLLGPLGASWAPKRRLLALLGVPKAPKGLPKTSQSPLKGLPKVSQWLSQWPPKASTRSLRGPAAFGDFLESLWRPFRNYANAFRCLPLRFNGYAGALSELVLAS